MTLKRDRQPAIGIVLVALAIAALWWQLRMRFPLDDTFITFRYAANLAHGFGIVWNPGGPHTEGYTNFLFMLLLTPFSAMGLDLVVVSQTLGVIAVVISSVAIYRIARGSQAERSTLRSPLSAFAVALFLLDPFTWFNAYSGVETSLFTMWLLLVVATWEQPRQPFIFATLAALTRPEGVMIGGILLLVKLWQTGFSDGTHRSRNTNWSHLIMAAVLFALPLLVYALWKLWYFSNLLPNSFYVKIAQPAGIFPGRGTLRIFYTGIWYLPVLSLWAVREWRNPTVQIIVIWCIPLSILYLFSQLIQPQYGRFTYSIEAMLMITAALGAVRMKRGWLVLLVGFHVVWAMYFRLGTAYATQDTSYTDRYERLAQVLQMIPDREHITFCWSDAGVLPFESGMMHLDPVGLNTTAIAHAKSSAEVLEIIARARPDIIFIPLVKSADSCRTIDTNGHGLIGRAYPQLMWQPELRSYRAIALVPQTVYDLDIFVDTLSPHSRQIAAALQAHYPKPPSCIR